MINEELFRRARSKVIAEDTQDKGIGTLSEKSMHKIIKLYIDPDEANHEVKVMGSVADVLNDRGLFEIQTGAISALIPKIGKFINEYHVTVVHPIVAKKKIRWLDRSTGELSDGRKSPAKGTLHSSAFELYKSRRFIGEENFSVKLLFLECEEFRSLDGWDSTGKKGSSRIERIPTALLDEIDLHRAEDYRVFLPDELGESFFASDFKKVIRSRSRYDYYTLRLLCELGIIKKSGKKGNAIIYSRV